MGAIKGRKEEFEKVWNERKEEFEKNITELLDGSSWEEAYNEWWIQHYRGIDKVMAPEKAIEFLKDKKEWIMEQSAFKKLKVSDEHIKYIDLLIDKYKMRAEKNSNIETLTKEKLLEYGFKEQQINEILSNSSYEGNCINDSGQYWVSMIEEKIYSGEEYYAKGFKMIFPKSADLLPEYYNRKLSDFIEKAKEFEKSLFDETECKEQFKKKEMEFTEDCLKQREKFKGLHTMVNENKLYHLYLKWIKKQPTATTDQPKTKAKAVTKDEPETRTLKELFRNKGIYEDCLQLLRDIDNPAIDEESRFISKNKGVLVVWYNALETKGIIQKVINDKQRAAILKNTFENYSVSEGQFRQKNERATEDFRSGFLTDLAAIITQKH